MFPALSLGTNLCSSGNGGCSQLCLPFPGGRTCLCGQGFLPINEINCVTDTRCPSDTKQCLRGEECIPLKQFCDGEPDCADDSDEICEDNRVLFKPGQISECLALITEDCCISLFFILYCS